MYTESLSSLSGNKPTNTQPSSQPNVESLSSLQATEQHGSKYMTQQTFNSYAQKLPGGYTAAQLARSLMEKGYILQGLNDKETTGNENDTVSPTSTTPQDQTQPQKGFWASLPDRVGTVYSGIAKGLGRTTADVLGGITSAGGLMPGFGGGQTEKTLSSLSQSTKPQGLGETLGYGMEKTLELLAPAAVESKLVSGLSTAAESLPEFSSLPSVAKNAIQSGIKAIVGGALTGGATAIGGGTKEEVSAATKMGGIAGGLAGVLSNVAPGLMKSLVKSEFKLTPQQQTVLAPKIEQASKFITDNGITGTTNGKFSKLSKLNNELEDTISSAATKDISIPTSQVEEKLNNIINLPEIKSNKAVYNAVKNDAQDAIKTLKETEGDTISLDSLLSAKRSYGQEAFGRATAKVKESTVKAEGAFAVESAYQQVLSDALNQSQGGVKVPENLKKYFGGKDTVSLKEFNQVYSQAINSKKLIGAARFKKDTGLVGRFFGLWAGESLGQVIAPGLGGKLIGGGLGEVASSHLPSVLRAGAEKALQSGALAEPLAKGYLGYEAATTPSESPTQPTESLPQQ